jgi:hypothetical protein
MIFRSITPTNDWNFGAGKQSYLKNTDAIAANVKTRLQTFLGECFFALSLGVDWWNLLGSKNPVAQQNIILQCRTIIAGSYGVTRIRSVTPSFTSASRRLTVTYNIDTIYTRNQTGSITL